MGMQQNSVTSTVKMVQDSCKQTHTHTHLHNIHTLYGCDTHGTSKRQRKTCNGHMWPYFQTMFWSLIKCKSLWPHHSTPFQVAKPKFGVDFTYFLPSKTIIVTAPVSGYTLLPWCWNGARWSCSGAPWGGEWSDPHLAVPSCHSERFTCQLEGIFQ